LNADFFILGLDFYSQASMILSNRYSINNITIRALSLNVECCQKTAQTVKEFQCAENINHPLKTTVPLAGDQYK